MTFFSVTSSKGKLFASDPLLSYQAAPFRAEPAFTLKRMTVIVRPSSLAAVTAAFERAIIPALSRGSWSC